MASVFLGSLHRTPTTARRTRRARTADSSDPRLHLPIHLRTHKASRNLSLLFPSSSRAPPGVLSSRTAVASKLPTRHCRRWSRRERTSCSRHPRATGVASRDHSLRRASAGLGRRNPVRCPTNLRSFTTCSVEVGVRQAGAMLVRNPVPRGAEDGLISSCSYLACSAMGLLGRPHLPGAPASRGPLLQVLAPPWSDLRLKTNSCPLD